MFNPMRIIKPFSSLGRKVYNGFGRLGAKISEYFSPFKRTFNEGVMVERVVDKPIGKFTEVLGGASAPMLDGAFYGSTQGALRNFNYPSEMTVGSRVKGLIDKII